MMILLPSTSDYAWCEWKESVENYVPCEGPITDSAQHCFWFFKEGKYKPTNQKGKKGKGKDKGQKGQKGNKGKYRYQPYSTNMAPPPNREPANTIASIISIEQLGTFDESKYTPLDLSNHAVIHKFNWPKENDDIECDDFHKKLASIQHSMNTVTVDWIKSKFLTTSPIFDNALTHINKQPCIRHELYKTITFLVDNSSKDQVANCCNITTTFLDSLMHPCPGILQTD